MKYLSIFAFFLSTVCISAEYQLSEKTIVHGLVFKAGTRLILAPNGDLERGTLDAETLFSYFAWSPDLELTFFPFPISSPPSVFAGKLGAVKGQGMMLRGTQIKFLPSTRVLMMQSDPQRARQFTISEEILLFADASPTNNALINTEILLNDDFSIRSATLTKSFDYMGYKLREGQASFYPAGFGKELSLGKLRSGMLLIDTIIGGTLLPSGSQIILLENGQIDEVLVSRITKYAEAAIPAASTIYFKGGYITHVYIEADFLYKGKTFIAKQFVPFTKAGEPYIPAIK